MSDLGSLSDHYSSRDRAFARRLIEEGFCIPTCNACSTKVFPARSHCPHCAESDWSYPPADGKGRVVGHTIVRQASDARFETPVTSALVQLDDGPTVVCAVVDDSDGVAVGNRLEFSGANVVHGHVRLLFTPE